MYANVFTPLDGSELAETILPDVEELASKLGLEVVLFQAIMGLTETMSGTHIALDVATRSVEEDRQFTTEYLEGVAQRLRAKGLNVSVLVGDGPPAQTVLHHLDDGSIVAMTTHGRSGLRRSLLGSVADEVMRHAKGPVFLRRPPE